MSRIDLDAARAARQEVLGTGPVVVFGGEDFELPAELPYEVVEALGKLGEAKDAQDGAAAAAAVVACVRGMLGERYPAFVAHRPSSDDMAALLEQALPEYGTSPGESQASGS